MAFSGAGFGNEFKTEKYLVLEGPIFYQRRYKMSPTTRTFGPVVAPWY